MVSPEYGLPSMAGHSTWLQVGAELGFPGLLCLLGLYVLTVFRMWPIAQSGVGHGDTLSQHLARITVASLVGFVISAQFVSLEGVELPYYLVMIGAGVLKISSLQFHEPGAGLNEASIHSMDDTQAELEVGVNAEPLYVTKPT
jgi:hypothetical protein